MSKRAKSTTSVPSERKQRGRVDAEVMFPVAPSQLELPADYMVWFGDLKQRIAHERMRMLIVSNAAMVLLYWDIGTSILAKQTVHGWGAKVIDRLSADLCTAF